MNLNEAVELVGGVFGSVDDDILIVDCDVQLMGSVVELVDGA